MIQATEPDVIGPSVAAHHPDAPAEQIVRDRGELPRVGRVDAGQRAAECFEAAPLGSDLGFGLLGIAGE